MLWNYQKNILIILSLIELIFYFVPFCYCFKSTPLWHCIPTCFQVPVLRPILHDENEAQQLVEVSPQRPYIIRGSYRKSFRSPNQINDANLPQQQQQHQKYEQNESLQVEQYGDDEPIIYIAETTPNPYKEEIFGAKKMLHRQPQPVPIYDQYYTEYLPEALSAILNATISMQQSPISAIDETEKDPSSDLQQTSFSVLKRQKMARKKFERNNLAKRAAFPSSVCNSRGLYNIMFAAMTADISESKRWVIKAVENAYQGIKFDVVCVEDNFSYTVHARKYCEVTKNNITCFAFR